MVKVYTRINWENQPSTKTALGASNLNKTDYAINEIDNRVISLDETKADKATIQEMVKSITFNEANGVFTVTYLNGTVVNFDTKLEKLAVNFGFDESKQQLVITLDDGTIQYVDMSALLTQYEFLDSDTITISIDDSGKVTAKVKEGSIEEKHLKSDYLADIKVEAAKAEASAAAAKESEQNAAQSEANAADSKDVAYEKAEAASASAAAAAASAAASKTSETNSAASEAAAKISETNAAASEAAAKTSETNSKTSETNAAASAKESEDYSGLSKSYAVGTGNEVRENDDTDNSEYYCNLSHGYRDEAEKFSKSAEDAQSQINKKLELAEFGIDDDGNLVYTDNSAYNFSIDDGGNLIWEVA